jgi:uncharacterized protein (DUF427 family)
MNTKTIKIPGPDHPITISPNPKRVTVTVGGKVVADSFSALTLHEASYPAAFYIPRKDVEMALLSRTEPTARIRAIAPTTVLQSAATDRSMLSGPTRRRLMPSQR